MRSSIRKLSISGEEAEGGGRRKAEEDGMHSKREPTHPRVVGKKASTQKDQDPTLNLLTALPAKSSQNQPQEQPKAPGTGGRLQQ